MLAKNDSLSQLPTNSSEPLTAKEAERLKIKELVKTKQNNAGSK